METTAPGITLYVYSCPNKHRMVRQSKQNPAPCSRCDCPKPFTLVNSVEVREGETLIQATTRALGTKPVKVN